MRYVIIGRKTTLCLFVLFFGTVLAVCAAIATSSRPVAAPAAESLIPIYSVETDERVVALGINCAWDDADIPELLELLAANDIKATFFVVGSWCDKYPETLKLISAAGHEIGNHSQDHADMTTLDTAGITAELEECSDTIERLTGNRPTLFRPPSGAYNDLVVQTANSLGYHVIQWDVDSIDWQDPTPQVMIERVLSNVRNGSITLFHSGATNTPAALPQIIASLLEQGYEFRTVSQMIHTENYTTDHTGRQHPME